MTTFAQPSGVSDLAATLTHEIKTNIRNRHDPRGMQETVGPSELGMECPRRLAYRLLLQPKTNTGGSSWGANIGTAVHTFLENIYRHTDPDPGRYLVETKVTIRGNITGTCDLYDRHRGLVLDWKIVGDSALQGYRRNGPGPQYETQAHLYGLGFSNAGEQVRHVAIAFLPRSHSLDGLWVWTAPYQPEVAAAALERYDDLLELLAALDMEQHPQRWGTIPAVPSAACKWCDWYLPGSTDAAVGCAGTSA